MTELIELLTQQSKTRREHVYTEADTRAVLIDPLLDVLGWRQEDIRREPYDGWPEEKGYLDYLIRLNARPFMVVEAKKTGRTFDIPESLAKQGATTLKKLRKTGSKDLTEALDQCIKYAGHCGAPYSCATNGLDYIFFKPNHIGRDQLSAKVVVFRGIDNVLSGIDNFEKLFKKSLVEGGTAEQILVGRETQIAEFCRRLNDDIAKPASQNIESQDFSYILDQIVRNFILELKNEEMFDKCYVRVPWVRTTNDAFEAILRNQLVSQESREEHRGAATVNRIADETMNSCEVGGRTIVVHGPIGIGKTSFLRQLPKTLLKGRSEKLAQTLQWMHIDLLDFFNRKFNAENYSELTDRICETIRENLVEKSGDGGLAFDPDDWRHLRDVYNKEAVEFQKAKFPESTDADDEYLKAVRDYIWELKKKDPQQHLLRVLYWITVTQNIPVVLVLDNSDQLGLEFQEVLYELSLGIQKKTSAITLLTLRTEALCSHRIRRNMLANVEESYEVQRASLVEVLSARFRVVREVVQKESRLARDTNLPAALDRIEVLLETLISELRTGSDVAAIIQAVGNENLRRTMDAVSQVFKLDQKVMDRLVANSGRGNQRLNPGYVLRALMRRGGSRYDSSKPDCLIPNVYDVDRTRVHTHELRTCILRQIRSRTTKTDAPEAKQIVADFIHVGLDGELLRSVLANMRREGLINVSHMLGDISDEDAIRTTQLANGLLDTICMSNEYLSAVAWDSSVYSKELFQNMKGVWNSRDYSNIGKAFSDIKDLFVEHLKADIDKFRSSFDTSRLEGDASVGLSL